MVVLPIQHEELATPPRHAEPSRELIAGAAPISPAELLQSFRQLMVFTGDQLDAAFQRQFRLHGSLQAPPSQTVPQDVQQQIRHNEIQLRGFCEESSVEALLIGGACVARALVDLEDGLLQGIVMKDYEVFGDGWGEIRLRVERMPHNEFTVAWGNHSGIRALAPRFQTYFRRGRAFSLPRTGLLR